MKKKFEKISLQLRWVTFPLKILFIEIHASYKLCNQAITHFANSSGLSAHKLELLLIMKYSQSVLKLKTADELKQTLWEWYILTYF